MGFWDIVGWTPEWHEPKDSLATNRSKLLGLIGQEVAEVWGIWHLGRDEWFADFPVVIVFASGLHLEICWQKLSSLSLTWNTLELDDRIRSDETWQLQWRTLVAPGFELEPVRGALVEEVRGVDFLFETREMGTSAAQIHQTWLTAGLWLRCSESGICVFNALDENGVANSQLESATTRSFVLS